ncbi:MAG: DUF418 domain-containing protein [Pyrinomonadaceae bacterium]|nr:DUF418 domain-containing protein [Phycisphaerales bacterium]
MEVPGRILSPLSLNERIGSLDTLRGVALLGILVMNIRNFALPLKDFDNPAFPVAPAETSDVWCWAVANIFFEDKMIGIFSMLFGAGIIVMTARAGAGLRPIVLHYRRMCWLLVIGLLHAYLLWYGDILNTYAICGALIFPFRRFSPAMLISLGLAVIIVAVGIRAQGPMSATVFPPPLAAAQASPEQPKKQSNADRIIKEAMENEAAAYHGSWVALARWRAKLNTFWHYHGVVGFNLWRCAGFMLIGMGLLQLGLIGASRPAHVYAALMVGGYVVGLTLCLMGFWPQLSRVLGRTTPLAPAAREMWGLIAWTARYLGAVALAIGHVGLVMFACQSRRLSILLAPLASVGRMALSNYLMHTLIAVLMFDGWAFGQWGTWRFSELTMLVAGVWAVQIILSPLWLSFFRYGPVEWAWRSLTYWKVQTIAS